MTRRSPRDSARRLLAIATTLAATGALGASVSIELPAEKARFRPASLPGYELATTRCVICHSADYIAYQPPALSLWQWTAEVTKMRHTYGAPLTDDEVVSIGAYLAVAYGSASSDDEAVIRTAAATTVAPPAAATPVRPADAQTLLQRNGCLGCHAVDHKIVGPAYHDVAERYRTDPQAQSKLETSVRGGSSGKWGTAAMPPFPSLTADELRALVEFVRRQ